MTNNIKDFDPKKNPKYHHKIYRYLRTKRTRIETRGMPRLVRFDYGFETWRIGWLENGDFIGCCIGFDKKIEEFCYLNVTEKDITAEVDWATYRRIGACALSDYAHRWQRINRNWRRCANCRQMQRRRVVTVKTVERREIFENV